MKTSCPGWRYLLVLFFGVAPSLAAADSLADSLAGASPVPPPFSRICQKEGFPITTWAHTLCVEGHRRAWQEDPEKWLADQSRPPDPPRVEVYRPEKIPFASDRENISLPPPDPIPLDPWSGE